MLALEGLIIPDLPVEESDYIIYLCYQFNIELIFLIAPTSTTERIKNIIHKAPGCLYVVSKTGVTGNTSMVQPKIYKLINDVKHITFKPLLLGFGISTLDQIRQLCTADIEGIVVGSAFVKKLSDKETSKGIISISKFCQEIKEVIAKYPQGNLNPRYLREREMS